MASKLTIENRVRRLEESHLSFSDREILAWGEQVTDDELRRLIREEEEYEKLNPISEARRQRKELEVKRLSEAEVFRRLRPAIEALRQKEARQA